MKTLMFRTILALSMVAVIFSVTPQAVIAGAPAPDPQTAKFETNFMEGMIDHHAMAVMMAEMCTMKTVHPELIATCQDIITTQSQEIETMQGWLQDWYGITYEPKMMMGEMQGHMMMEADQFEIWFMKRMISHHAQAIKEAQDCLEEGYHGELISMCQNIIVTQFQEIEMMQTWLCEWYGLCNYRKNL